MPANYPDWTEKGYVYLTTEEWRALQWIKDLYTEQIEFFGDVENADDITILKVEINKNLLVFDIGKEDFKVKSKIPKENISVYSEYEVIFSEDLKGKIKFDIKKTKNNIQEENNTIQEFKHGVLNTMIGELPENIPLKIAKKLGFKQAEYINSGYWGNIYDIGILDKLMKLTMDKEEAATSFKLKGKKLKNVVNFYDVYQIDLSKYVNLKNILLFVIIMDKVDFDKEKNQKLDNNLDNTIQTYYFDHPQDSKFEDLNMMVSYMTTNPYLSDYGLEQYIKSIDKRHKNGIFEFYQFIISLTRELKEYGITYADIHHGNLGRRNGKLISFDMGVSTGGEEPKEKIKVEETINYNDLLKEYYIPPDIVSLILQIDNYKGVGVGEIYNKDENSLIVLDRYYHDLNSYDVEVGQLSGKEKIIDIKYDYGKYYEDNTERKHSID